MLHSERDGSLAWQPGANRSLNLGADGAPALVVLDDWAGPRHEVTPAEPAAAEASQEEPQPEAPLAAAQPEPSEGATAAAAEQRPQPEAAHPGEVEAAAEQPALAAAALAAPAKGPKPTAEASWQAALAVANQPVVVPHPPAPAAAEEPPVPAGKPAEQPKASAESSWQTVRDVANQPHVPAKPAPAAAASKGAVLAAREELAPVVAPAADAPAQRSLPRWLRLALAAALVLAAVIAFLRSPFAAARWALLHC